MAGGDPFHTASFRLTTADATPGVLISTLEDGYLTIWATGLGANESQVVRSKSLRQIPVVRVGFGEPAYSTVDWRPSGLAFIK